MKIKLLSILLFGYLMSSAQKVDYTAYSKLLNQYVNESGKVDYANLKTNQRELNKIIADFEKQDVWKLTRSEDQLAFCINVYNANTLKLIVDHYPIKSITDLDNGKPWDIKRVKGAAQLFSLNQIENEIIRPIFKDPRVHFALNCAAISCPPLFNKVFLPDELNNQLEARTKKFIQSTIKQDKTGKIIISKIFEWYKTDFGDVISFINKYSINHYPMNEAIQYQEYDWKLNEK